MENIFFFIYFFLSVLPLWTSLVLALHLKRGFNQGAPPPHPNNTPGRGKRGYLNIQVNRICGGGGFIAGRGFILMVMEGW